MMLRFTNDRGGWGHLQLETSNELGKHFVGASTNATVPNAVLIYAADPLPFWPICLFAQVPLTFLPLCPFCHWPCAAMYQKPLCPKCRLRHLPLCTKCLSSKCLYSPLPFGDKCPYETNAVQGQMPFWFKGNWEYKILTFMLGKHWFKRYITREAHMCNRGLLLFSFWKRAESDCLHIRLTISIVLRFIHRIIYDSSTF